ncbi:MAG TPA: hypothetical protein DG942_07745 [Ruminococcaceae bacterium]|nr:hypothetical protein [Oscillospiraceae bacterium]
MRIDKVPLVILKRRLKIAAFDFSERKNVKMESRSAAEMPIGLMMSLAMHPEAMHSFGQMDDEKQQSVIRYVENAKTGEEAKNRIYSAIKDLENGSTSFLG